MRLDRIRNETIREMMEMAKDMIHEMQKRQLLWSGHSNTMEEPRWPREVLKWVPQERRNGAGRDGAGEAI
jgi:hypothetical protein